MQLTAPAPATTPVPRTDAAKALIAVPMGIVMTATMTAMTKSMSGQAASRADLVAPLLEKLSVDQAKGAMLQAIDGAIAAAPELAPRAEALRQAADGIAALLADAATDATKGDANQSLERLTTPLEPLMGPIMEAALVLDPSLAKPQPAPAR
jgi:hypothetical protein